MIGEDADRTLIRPRAPLYTITYSGAGEPETNFAAYKNRVEIGRGSKDFFVDMKLEGDQASVVWQLSQTVGKPAAGSAPAASVAA